jgi:hypothetical protein
MLPVTTVPIVHAGVFIARRLGEMLKVCACHVRFVSLENGRGIFHYDLNEGEECHAEYGYKRRGEKKEKQKEDVF